MSVLLGPQSVSVPPSPVTVLSPGVSVLFGNASGGGGPMPIYVLSPGVSVATGGGGGTGTVPVYVLSRGVSVSLGVGGGAGGNQPAYVLSPGVSVLLSPTAGGASTESVYVLSPGVSVGYPQTLGTLGSAPIYVLSPGTSIQNGPRSTVGGTTGEAMPVYVLSPGVSVQPLIPTTGGGGGNSDDGTLFIVSPGVSVAPASVTGHALPPAAPSGHFPKIARLTPSRMARGGVGLVTVRGAHLDDAQAVGFLDDAGHLDTGITVHSAVVSDRGQAMTLRLSVSPQAAPGRRRLFVWMLPRRNLTPAHKNLTLPSPSERRGGKRKSERQTTGP